MQPLCRPEQTLMPAIVINLLTFVNDVFANTCCCMPSHVQQFAQFAPWVIDDTIGQRQQNRSLEDTIIPCPATDDRISCHLEFLPSMEIDAADHPLPVRRI
jgi:hypothetical protein